MAEFQHMDGSKVASPITAVVGNSIHLKVIPGSKEALPSIFASPESIAKVSHIDERKKQDFTTFHLDAVAAGKASLKATDAKKTVAGPLDIVVEDQVALPDAGKDAGLLVRLFLAEVPSPEEAGYKLVDAKTSMIWMRVVVQNRLATPSPIWGMLWFRIVWRRHPPFGGRRGSSPWRMSFGPKVNSKDLKSIPRSTTGSARALTRRCRSPTTATIHGDRNTRSL